MNTARVLESKKSWNSSAFAKNQKIRMNNRILTNWPTKLALYRFLMSNSLTKVALTTANEDVALEPLSSV